MSFSELNVSPLLCRNLRAIGFKEPRPIQGQVIGPMLEGRDVIGLAKTGMGKTAAFLIPVADRLLADKPPKKKGRAISPWARLRAIVLCPTRELAIQVEEDARQIMQGSVLRSDVVYGKVGMQPQAEKLRAGIDLLVATPGRLRELMDADLIVLDSIRHVVIDEADRMFDMGFLPQVRAILDALPAERQIALFTATFPNDVAELAETVLKQPVRIEVDPHTMTVDHVEQHLVEVENDDKVSMLLQLMNRAPKDGVLIFCRTRRRVGWVGAALKRQGVPSELLHGDRTQAQRLRALSRLEDGSARVVVATDVASRGLHIPSVKWVINYDLPNDVEAYVHRIGRAGHGGGRGTSWTMLTMKDQPFWREFAQQLKLRLEPETVEGFTPTLRPVSPSNANWFEEAQFGARESDPNRGRKGKRPPGAGRTRKKAIAKGEKPGGGVRRITGNVSGPGESQGGQDGKAGERSLKGRS
jgi:ATP-dependent RNA helicase RhlE